MQCDPLPGWRVACTSSSEGTRFHHSHQSRPDHPGVSDGNSSCCWWHTYIFLTMAVWTQLRDWIWENERGFRLIETGLQLQAVTRSFPSSPSHSIEKDPYRTNFLVWGRHKQAQITRSHCTCQAVCSSSWSGKYMSGGGQACQSALDGGGWAAVGRSRYGEYVVTIRFLGEHGTTRVWHRLPWCWHRWAFYIDCDPARGVSRQEGHNLQVW